LAIYSSWPERFRTRHGWTGASSSTRRAS
jgi:hypothetical protein